MKAALKNKQVTENEVHRGRPEIQFRIPKRKTGVTIKQVVQFNHNQVSEQVVRNRLNKMTHTGEAEAVVIAVPPGERHRPEIKYTILVP